MEGDTPTGYRLGEFTEAEVIALGQGEVPAAVRLRCVAALEANAQIYITLLRNERKAETDRLELENESLKRKARKHEPKRTDTKAGQE